MLAATVPGDRFGRTFAERIAEMLAYKAVKGDIRAARELADRAEGKPRQAIELARNDSDEFFLGHENNEDLDYFCKFGVGTDKPWPTPEEVRYYKEKGRWPQEEPAARQ